LCNLFEIPFDTGYNAFYHAEKLWDSSRRTMHYYDTYWNDLRAANNISLEDISQMTGIGKSSISNHFSGKNIPRKAALEKYCELFDISIEDGEKEFKKAHEQYLASQNGSEPVQEVTTDADVPTDNVPTDNVDYTFWPSAFVNSQFSVKDIARYLNVSEDKVTQYFTGEVIPNFNQLRMLCSLYGGVDMKVGNNAFNLLHKHFLTEKDSLTTTPNNISDTHCDISDNLIDSILRAFFNEASYEGFIELQKLLYNKDSRALKIVYSIVDYDTYTALEAVLGK
jgi:transcriptional regulator with XRE-family HTH domain